MEHMQTLAYQGKDRRRKHPQVHNQFYSATQHMQPHH